MLIRNVSLLLGRELDYVNTACVRISNKYIEAIRKNLQSKKDEQIIDCEGLLMMPGLINAHTHIGDSIAKDINVDEDVESKIHPVTGFKQKILKSSDVSHLTSFIQSSCLSMIRKGITTFIDFREGGIGGVNVLRRASTGIPIRPVILGRIEFYQDFNSIKANSAMPESKRSDLSALLRN